MHDVERPLGDQAAERAQDAGRGPAARLRRGHEVEAELVDARLQRAGLGEDDDVVAEVADARGELDRVQLAPAELQHVRVDGDPHAAARSDAGSGASPLSRAGLPNHRRAGGTSRVTTEPIPTIAQAPIATPSRTSAPLPR